MCSSVTNSTPQGTWSRNIGNYFIRRGIRKLWLVQCSRPSNIGRSHTSTAIYRVPCSIICGKYIHTWRSHLYYGSEVAKAKLSSIISPLAFQRGSFSATVAITISNCWDSQYIRVISWSCGWCVPAVISSNYIHLNAVISFVAAVLTVFVILPEFVVAQEPRSDVICNVLNITNLSIASKPSGGTDVLGIISNNNSTLTYESVGIVWEFYDSDDKLVGIKLVMRNSALLVLMTVLHSKSRRMFQIRLLTIILLLADRLKEEQFLSFHNINNIVNHLMVIKLLNLRQVHQYLFWQISLPG